MKVIQEDNKEIKAKISTIETKVENLEEDNKEIKANVSMI